MARVTTFWLFVSLASVITTSSKQNESVGDRCFCKLTGEVDDCSCKVETLDTLNNNKLYPILKSLLEKDYFRYFQVNLNKGCPFWTDDSRCALKDCHVSKCPEEKIPEGLKGKGNQNGHTDTGKVDAGKYSEAAQITGDCEEERKLGALNKTISNESMEAFKDWTKYDDAQETFCEIDDESSNELQYVDLLLNPERYTGYKGASLIAYGIVSYNENCFKPDHQDFSQGYLPHPVPRGSSDEGMCLEKRAFYRLISGLHTSINIHLCAKYLLPDKTGYGTSTWGHNVKEFQKRFDPKKNPHGPQWLKNLYFTYLVELRALAKAAPYLLEENFYTGNKEDDIDVKNGVREVLTIAKSFNDHFDESKLFKGDASMASTLKKEFREHFRNISRIMDCVGCDKCRLWGKLQVQGMGTALKILFSGNSVGPNSIVSPLHKESFQLRRTEIVSLFNAFGRLSSSIKNLKHFRTLLQ
ncbi:ERO1-like protein beta [Liolophura sinensis]|uniref:ERO1-like protein beta n=1 Tax=Liolophura sinensis TaxID=3198878 RepID=UPI0031592B77